MIQYKGSAAYADGSKCQIRLWMYIIVEENCNKHLFDAFFLKNKNDSSSLKWGVVHANQCKKPCVINSTLRWTFIKETNT